MQKNIFKIKASSSFLFLLYFIPFLIYSQITISKEGEIVDEQNMFFNHTSFNKISQEIVVGENLAIYVLNKKNHSLNLDSLGYYLVLEKDEKPNNIVVLYSIKENKIVDLIEARKLDKLLLDYFFSSRTQKINCSTCIKERCFDFSFYNLHVFDKNLQEDSVINLPKNGFIYDQGLAIYDKYLFLGMCLLNTKISKYFQRVFIFDTELLKVVHTQDFYAETKSVAFGSLAINKNYLYLKTVDRYSLQAKYYKYKINLE